MKLFLDMRPAFNPALSPLSGLSFGLAAAAVANGAEDVFFIRDFPRDPELPEATLLPGEFIKWALQSDWEGGVHLRKLADGAVQQGRLDKALVKFESETRVVLLVAPLDSGAMAQFDAAALATEDLSILRFPELLEAPWEQGWREGASALFARADLICCASESVWRDYETIAGEAAPAVITPTPPRLPHANPSAPLPPEQALMMLCDRGILWEPVWAAVREMTEIVGLDWRLELLHGLYGEEPPVIPVDLAGRTLSQRIGDFPALRARLRAAAALLDVSVTSTSAYGAREANRLGVPVIAAIGRGAADVCDLATTQLVDPQKPEGLAAAMVRALRAPLDIEAQASLSQRALAEGWARAGARILDAVYAAAHRR